MFEIKTTTIDIIKLLILYLLSLLIPFYLLGGQVESMDLLGLYTIIAISYIFVKGFTIIDEKFTDWTYRNFYD